MKRTILLFFLLVFGISSFSQSISVKSFRALPNDMDARQNYPEKDMNGDLCAIIKIATLEKGFSFDIGSLGITKTEQKDGEIWIWIPRGAKRITITHKAFLPLRDYFFTESIQEGVCYEMFLVSGKVVTTVVEEEIPTQWLLINTNPPGADVYINDVAAGKTPYQNELAVGKYTWRVQKELYLNDAGVVELLTGTQKQKIDLTFKVNYGTVQLSSSPENGASVTLNGIETGKVTPCVFEKLPVGDHMITISRDMYATTTERFSITAGETKPISINMNPTFAGITLSTEPIADIYINGEFKANSKWQGRLNPGIYTFEAKLDKHQTAIEKQTVTIGQPINLTLRPTPKTGNLKVISTPFEATIKMNGKEMGQTPVTLKNILIGDYTVELSLAGYANAIEKAAITEGQMASINAILVKGDASVSITPVLTLSKSEQIINNTIPEKSENFTSIDNSSSFVPGNELSEIDFNYYVLHSLNYDYKNNQKYIDSYLKDLKKISYSDEFKHQKLSEEAKKEIESKILEIDYSKHYQVSFESYLSKYSFENGSFQLFIPIHILDFNNRTAGGSLNSGGGLGNFKQTSFGSFYLAAANHLDFNKIVISQNSAEKILGELNSNRTLYGVIEYSLLDFPLMGNSWSPEKWLKEDLNYNGMFCFIEKIFLFSDSKRTKLVYTMDASEDRARFNGKTYGTEITLNNPTRQEFKFY